MGEWAGELPRPPGRIASLLARAMALVREDLTIDFVEL